jgi:hypothetical protein
VPDEVPLHVRWQRVRLVQQLLCQQGAGAPGGGANNTVRAERGGCSTSARGTTEPRLQTPTEPTRDACGVQRQRVLPRPPPHLHVVLAKHAVPGVVRLLHRRHGLGLAHGHQARLQQARTRARTHACGAV